MCTNSLRSNKRKNKVWKNFAEPSDATVSDNIRGMMKEFIPAGDGRTLLLVIREEVPYFDEVINLLF